MAFVKVSRPDVWAAGVTVSAYPKSNWTQSQLPPSGAPVGAAAGSGVVQSDGSVTITGLVANGDYFLSSGGAPYISVKVPPVTAAQAGDRDNGQAGLLAPTSGAVGPTAVTLVANQAFVVRFVPSRDMTITKIGFVVSTAASIDDPVDVGIFDATLARLVSLGATLGLLNSLGVKAPAIAATLLRAGTVYYAALSCGAIGGTAAQVLGAQFSIANFASIFGASPPQVECALKGASHPLPASIVTPGATGTAPFLALRES